MRTILRIWLRAVALMIPTALLLGAAVALGFWSCAVTNHHLPKPWHQRDR